jgi:uncharacterized protein YkwD
MARKPKTPKPHHTTHRKEKRTKRFLKVYAPYIPLLLIVGLGLFLSNFSDFKQRKDQTVLSYATNISDEGLLEATNQSRTENNLPILATNPLLDKAAQAKANDMAQRNYWAHSTPEGKEPWYFIEQAGYGYYRAAENLAYGFDTSKLTVVGWMNSPSHRANVLDPVLSEVGFGIANVANYQGKGAQTIVVAMYGKPMALPSTTQSKKQPTATPITKPNTSIPPREETKISYIQTLTNGQAPWSSFALGLLIGIIAAYLFIKHGHGLHKRFRKGEQFILHHPLLDTTLLALLALAAIVSQTAGTIY